MTIACSPAANPPQICDLVPQFSRGVQRFARYMALSRRHEHAFAVETQLVDRLMYVSARQVRGLLGNARAQPRHPATRQLLERADIEIAVVKETLELRHEACQKTPVLAYAGARAFLSLPQSRCQ